MYRLPNLPYAYDALEPFIDARTMEIHHSRFHADYVTALNEVLQDRNTLSRMTLEEIVADIRKVPEDIRQDVRNFGGAHLNHSLFWHILNPPGKNIGPAGALREAIEAGFGSFAVFQNEFTRVALERFGSGWAWLCMDSRGELEIMSTPNQDSPIMIGCRPVLGLDVWEHAYYLHYQDRREDYVEAWWNVVNWANVADLYAHCLERTEGVR